MSTNNCTLHRPKWVKVENITYKKPCALLIGIFGRLEKFFVINDRMFAVNTLKTSSFSKHLQA